MSRRKDNYEKSRWLKFRKWVDGETDLLSHGMEIQAPDQDSFLATEDYMGQNRQKTQEEQAASEAARKLRQERGIRGFRRFYQIMSVLLCFSIIFVLLWTIAYLPVFGNAGNPDNNEVSARYITQGLKETGAVNMVTGMILDYRAFDTFGESCVLFIASCCVFALLRIDGANRDKETRKRLEEANDRLFEPKNDIILQKCACVLVPFIMIFGIYIIVNGHLSPGGGFSGGAVLGSGLILYLNAFGFKQTGRFFYGKNIPQDHPGSTHLLLPGKELFLLYRGQPHGQRHSSGHSGGNPQQRPYPASEYLRGFGGGLHHVYILYIVPERRNVGWQVICCSIWRRRFRSSCLVWDLPCCCFTVT